MFKGTVLSGRGEGRKFIDLSWVKAQIKEKLGFTPYSGTLNIRLTKETVGNKKLLKNTTHLEICPENGYCTGELFQALIGSFECAIIIPQMPSYPHDVLEVISPFCLRERLKLVDGDEVTIVVDV